MTRKRLVAVARAFAPLSYQLIIWPLDKVDAQRRARVDRYIQRQQLCQHISRVAELNRLPNQTENAPFFPPFFLC